MSGQGKTEEDWVKNADDRGAETERYRLTDTARLGDRLRKGESEDEERCSRRGEDKGERRKPEQEITILSWNVRCHYRVSLRFQVVCFRNYSGTVFIA